jgi:hypothetical protein
MKHALGLMLAIALACLLSPVSASAQDPLTSNYSFTYTGPAAIGSDGTMYVTTSSYSWSFYNVFASTSPGSKLNAFKVTTTASNPDATLSFTGYSWVLNIGKSDRLFLGVGNFLYIIPTPFTTGTLEAVAADVTNGPLPGPLATTSILKVDLKATPIALKVSSAGSKEYLYLTTTAYTWSPFSVTTKVVILDSSDGSKIKEFTVE